MAGNEAKRQKKLMKKRQKDKLRRKQRAEAIPYAFLRPEKKIRLARQYPIYECRINPSWRSSGLANIVVSRRQPDGGILFGVYLVDLLCLGVKNAFCNADFSVSQYETELIERLNEEHGAVPCSRDLAHRIIYGGIEFARQFGFKPHKDFELAQHILDPPDSLGPRLGIEFGRNGKPLFVPGPDDNVPRILRQLQSATGLKDVDSLIAEDSPFLLDR